MTSSQVSAQIRIRSSLAAVRLGTRNAVKCSHAPAESEAHRWVKWQVCDFCYANGLQFVTEASLKGGGRADIIILEWGLCLEVCSTEEVAHALKKTYPLPVLAVPASIQRAYLLTLLHELALTGGDADVVRHYQEALR